MQMRFTPARSALTGVAVLMACACGAGANSAKLLGTSAKLTHSVMLSVGVVLVVYGLWRIMRPAALIAIGGFVALVAGAALTPPMMMSSSNVPWAATQVGGGVLYLLFAAALAYAFFVAFPSPRPVAFATALGGTAIASGCSCCMITGAVAGLASTAGGDPAIFMRMPVVFFTGIAVAAVGLARLAGFRPIPWLVAGALLTQFGGRGLQLLGDWMVGGVNLRFIPGYLIYLLGAGLVMKAWAVAYEPIRTQHEQPVTGTMPQPAF